MQRISSRMTVYYKCVFPIVMFGFLLVFTITPFIVERRPPSASHLPFVILPAVMAVVFYVILRKLIFDLVDEAWDAGDALIIRNKGKEERIAFADIMNINYSSFINPPRVTLSLRQPSIFGDKVTFCAPVRFVPFATSPVVDDLIRRVDAARTRRR